MTVAMIRRHCQPTTGARHVDILQPRLDPAQGSAGRTGQQAVSSNREREVEPIECCRMHGRKLRRAVLPLAERDDEGERREANHEDYPRRDPAPVEGANNVVDPGHADPQSRSMFAPDASATLGP